MAESGVPILCTLHPNELGGRLEEWHRLFAGHLAGIQRPAPTRLRLLLAADAAWSGRGSWPHARWRAAPS
jgi:hypothetical protein